MDNQDQKDSKDHKGDEESQDNDWKDTKTVPYKRFEEVVRLNQEYRGKLDDMGTKLDTFINSQSGKSKQSGASEGEWDKRVKNAQSWDEVFGALPQTVVKQLLNDPQLRGEFVSSVKSEFKKEEQQAEEKVTKEIQSLYDKEIIESKAQEKAVINYAIKESEETGEYIPLSVAVRMMKKEGIWDKNLKDRKDANQKVNKGTESGGSEGSKSKSDYKKFKSKTIEEIVADGQANWQNKKT